MSGKMAATTSSSVSTMSRPHNLLPPPTTKASPPAKKGPKESKSDKSLETTVEKLTQNRNKEINAKIEVKTADKAEGKEKRVREGKKGEDKPSERVNEPPAKQNLDQKAGDSISTTVNAPSSDSLPHGPVNSSRVERVSSPAPVNSSSASPGKSSVEISSKGPKSEEALESGASKDVSGCVKKSPCTVREKEETSGSSTVTTNDSNSSKASEEVVEGGDK